MRLLFVAVCGLLLTMSTLCQTQPRKIQIALVDTEAFFDEKSGIRDLVDLVKPLESEFEGVNNELKSLGKEYNELGNAISKISKASEKAPSVEVSGDFASKIDRFQQLECIIKSKQEEAHRRYLIRRGEVTKNTSIKITDALKRYTTERGYVIVLDSSKSNESAIIEPDVEFTDVTSAFIKFFNERFGPPQPK